VSPGAVRDVSPLRRRLASRVVVPEEGFRTRMLELAATKTNVIALGRGDPDLPTPAHIVAAVKEAMDRGATHYTHPSGDLPLRRAIAAYIEATSGVVYDPATEIIVTTGAQEAVYLAMLTLIEPGDEVVLPSHRFTSYDMAAELSGGKVASYSTVIDGDYRLSAARIEGALSDRSTMLSVVSPDNPTGGVAAAADLAAVADLARRRDLLVISDEIYSRFVYDGRAHCSILSYPEMRERTLLVDGFSKCYAMTGWRVGYLAGPADYMRAIVEVKHTLTICTPSLSQVAALAALEGPQECVDEMRRIYDDRRHCLMAALADMELPYVHPAGAFYAYVDISSTGMASPDFCLRLLQDTGVMMFPGTMFGPEGIPWVRMSFLAPRDQIEEASDRLIGAVRVYRAQA
jgi:aminotransferase